MEKIDISEELVYIDKVKGLNEGKALKYYILTMGCQLNENDSEKLCGMLEKMNYTKTDNLQEADLVLFNTCCVRENAEERLFGKLGEVKKLREQKNTIIAIGGCMMQEKHIVDKIKNSYQYDIIFGTHTLHKFPHDLYRAIMEQKRINDVIDIDGEVIEGLPIKRNDNIKASVTIMNGCNNFCSYCIVPYVRGRERSRNPEDILNEIKDLANQGYKEVTLLGQNVNSYMVVENEKILKKQKDFSYENEDNSIEEAEQKTKKEIVQGEEINTFAKLLRAVNEIEGIEKIRFVSPHPKDFTDDVIDAIADCEKVSKLVHLPLQSGSTNVLKLMNRKYTKEQYLDLVEKMKNKIPNVTFSTDIIVGFAGETEEDFEDTLDVVCKVGFEQIFMFIYSKRVGTPGATMENQVPEETKHTRFDKLKKLYEDSVCENNQKYIGKVEKILVEGYSKNNEEMLTGRTDSNKVVIFEGKQELIGNMVDVKIVSEHMWYLKGEVI